VARWRVADALEFIDEIHRTSVGRFSKTTLRKMFDGRNAAGRRNTA